MASTIKVNTIQGASNTATTIKTNGGTDAMTIDTSGRILTPTRPSFYVRGNGGWKDHGSTRVVYFKTSNQAVEVISNVGSHYDASTGRFTVPVTGLYQFNVSLYCNQDGDGTTYAQFYVDGVHLHNNFMIYRNDDTGYPDNSLNFSIAVELTASQYMEIQVVEYLYGHHSYWNGALIG